MKYFFLIIIFVLLSRIQTEAQQIQIKVEGAGTKEVNGIYISNGEFNGKTRYTKGEFTIQYVGCQSKWMIIGPDGNYYRNMSDTELPPPDEWKKGCAGKSMPPMPILIIIKPEEKQP